MANTHNLFLKFEQEISLPKGKKKKLIASRQALQKRIIDYFKTKKGVLVPKFWIQGSYKMGTMVVDKEGMYDVDLGIYFLSRPSVEPSTLQKNVLDAVKTHTTSGVEHRDKCIRVIYAGDFDIDLPIYYKTESDSHPFLATKSGWKKSDPKELCDWFEKKQDSNGQLVRVIKYIKAWANHRSRKMPSGIALTVWAAKYYQPHGRDDMALFETLKRVKSDLWCGVECLNPATPSDDLCAKLDDNQKTNFKEALKNFMDEAANAINSDSMKTTCNIWRQQFGEKFPIA